MPEIGSCLQMNENGIAKAKAKAVAMLRTFGNMAFHVQINLPLMHLKHIMHVQYSHNVLNDIATHFPFVFRSTKPYRYIMS